MILLLGTASVARGLSGYIDALTNNSMSTTMRELMPIDVSFLSTYPDFLSLLFIAILTGKTSWAVISTSDKKPLTQNCKGFHMLTVRLFISLCVC